MHNLQLKHFVNLFNMTVKHQAMFFIVPSFSLLFPVLDFLKSAGLVSRYELLNNGLKVKVFVVSCGFYLSVFKKNANFEKLISQVPALHILLSTPVGVISFNKSRLKRVGGFPLIYIHR